VAHQDVTKGDSRNTMTNMDDCGSVSRVGNGAPADASRQRSCTERMLGDCGRREVAPVLRPQAALDSTCSDSRTARSASRRAEMATRISSALANRSSRDLAIIFSNNGS